MARSLSAGEDVTRGQPRTLMSSCGKMSIREQMTSTRSRNWLKAGQRRQGNAGKRGREPQMTFTTPLMTATRKDGLRNGRHVSRPATLARPRNHDLRANR